MDGGNNRARAEAILHENGQITLQYADIGTSTRDRGDQATVGIENVDGTMGFEYSYNKPVLNNTTAICFVPPVTNLLKNGSFEQYVLDANSNPRLTNSSAVAPAGAVKADVRMVVGSLNADILMDDFIFGK